MNRKVTWLVLALGFLVSMASLVSLSGCDVDVHNDHPRHGWYDDHHAWHDGDRP